MQEFARGLQLDGESVELQEEAKAARQLLSLEELHDVRIQTHSLSCKPQPDKSGRFRGIKINVQLWQNIWKLDAEEWKGWITAFAIGIGLTLTSIRDWSTAAASPEQVELPSDQMVSPCAGTERALCRGLPFLWWFSGCWRL